VCVGKAGGQPLAAGGVKVSAVHNMKSGAQWIEARKSGGMAQRGGGGIGLSAKP